MKLSLINIEKTEIFDIEYIKLSTKIGEITVTNETVPMILELIEYGNIFIKGAGFEKIFSSKKGLVNISRKEVKIYFI